MSEQKIVELNPTEENKEEIKEEIKEEKKIKLEDVLNKKGISNFEDIMEILSLPDEQFKTLSEFILIELENAIGDSNNLILLKEEMNRYDISQDELVDNYAHMMTALDTLEDVPQDRIDFLKRYIGMITNAFTEGQRASKRIIEIPIEISGDGKIPKYAYLGDAGIDIYAAEDYEIGPGETQLIDTGIRVAIPKGFELQVRPRSGLSLKTKMRVANAPGTVDSNYRGKVGVIIDNIEPKIKDITYDFVDNGKKIPEIKITSIEHGKSFFICKGERIAQLVLAEIPTAHFYKVDNIGVFKSDRGEEGFGSSGK